MGVMTDLFLATDNEAVTYGPGSSSRFKSVSLGGLTNLEYEILWAILENEDWDPEKHALTEIVGGESTWTFRFPDAYVERLKRANDADVAAAAEQWAATEEMGVTSDEALPLIRQLVGLANAGSPLNQNLYLWFSL